MDLHILTTSNGNITQFIFRKKCIKLFPHKYQQIKQNCQLSLTVTKYKTRQDFRDGGAGNIDYENYMKNTVRVGQTVTCWYDDGLGVTAGDTGVVRQVEHDVLTVDWKTAGRQDIGCYITQLM